MKRSKWRIMTVETTTRTWYVLQKRFLGFLWWYNPDNVDGAQTGVYDTKDEATKAYIAKKVKYKRSYEEIL